jgi:fumarylacetoacetase
VVLVGTGARLVIELPVSTLYGPANLPYGVFSAPGDPHRRIGVALGDQVLDVAPLAESHGAAELVPLLGAPVLNPLLGAGRRTWTELRERLVEWVHGPADVLRPHLLAAAEVQLHLPVEVGDYVDFYSSEHHARNVGQIFRPGSEPLSPNWKHLPIGYHGRTGTIVVSGTDIVRPCGQRRGEDGPEFGPSTRLDIEAEVGFVVGVPTGLGERVSVDDLADHVFGVVLVNDWSARDIQAWEYQPLGPFLGKSFATSVSPWVVPLEALAHAWTTAPAQDPPVADYLTATERTGLDLRLRVDWNGTTVTEPPFAGMYWTPAQQLAHLTVNGASLRTGDLFASGTVSGPTRGETGSFLELSWGGTESVKLADGSVRTYLEDGDTVTITATAPGADGRTIGLGAVGGTIRPAIA